jgi:hypothetical protein
MSNKGPALVNDVDRLVILLEEIAYAESQIQPHDTGHISTAIGWMQKRVINIKERLDASTK